MQRNHGGTTSAPLLCGLIRGRLFASRHTLKHARPKSRSAAGDVVRRNKAAQLAAFEFVMGTNRNMKKEEARQAVISEYGRWAKKHPNDARMMGGFLFFRYLQKERSDL